MHDTVGPWAGVATILVTSDGGAHWRVQRDLKDLLPTDVTFTDARHGWIVGGEPGFILATSDGGRHWHTQLSGTHDGLNSVSFVNASDGWVVGNGGLLYRTTNGGKTWTLSRLPVGWGPSAVSFADKQHGWVVTDGMALLATTDGGTSWTLAKSTRLAPLPVESRPRTFRATEAGHASSPATGATTPETQGDLFTRHPDDDPGR